MKMLYIFPFLGKFPQYLVLTISKYGLESSGISDSTGFHWTPYGVHMEYQGDRQDLRSESDQIWWVSGKTSQRHERSWGGCGSVGDIGSALASSAQLKQSEMGDFLISWWLSTELVVAGCVLKAVGLRNGAVGFKEVWDGVGDVCGVVWVLASSALTFRALLMVWVPISVIETLALAANPTL